MLNKYLLNEKHLKVQNLIFYFMYDLMDYITQVPSYVNATTKFTKFIIDRNCQSQERKI